MSERNRNLPASATHRDSSSIIDDGEYIYLQGLTKREAAAMRNMAAMMSENGAYTLTDTERQRIAKEAVKSADALFDELDGDKT